MQLSAFLVLTTVALPSLETISPGVLGTTITTITTTATTPALFSLTISTNVHGPVFDSVQYSGSVREHSPSNTTVSDINILVTDEDQYTRYNTFHLTLSAFNDTFTVVPSNGSGTLMAAILVLDPSKLNYDLGPRQYVFNVTASEVTVTPQSFASSALITVSLSGNNDYPPVFSPTTYNVSVSELAVPGMSVINISATDKDYGTFGNQSIWYRLVSSSDLFRCNKMNGEITVGPCNTPGWRSCLDYERVTSYRLTVQAVDNYGEGFSAMATVNVKIINENDNPPVFSQSAYYGTINENQTELNLPGVVINARDDYINNITYKVIQGDDTHLWTIDPSTQQLHAVRPVFFRNTPNNEGFFLLTIMAADNYTVSVTVNITVIVVNLFAPEFDKQNYVVTISNKSPLGTSVVTIHATDKDSNTNSNGSVEYYITAGSNGSFIVDNITGVVSLSDNTPLTRSSANRVYVMTIEAMDNGVPQRSTTAVLVVGTSDDLPQTNISPNAVSYGTLSPSFGPVAGGTKVTLTFNETLPEGPYVIYLINQWSRNHYLIYASLSGLNQLTFMTSGVNSADTGAWSVVLDQTTNQRYLASTPYIYRSNPDVQNISPQNQSIFGGTRMTVTGSSLNAVAYPVVHALVKIYRPPPSGTGQQNYSLYDNYTTTPDTPRTCLVEVNVDYQMICPMPNLHLPQDFVDKLKQDMDNEIDQSERRRKRRDNTFTIEEVLLSRQKRQYSGGVVGAQILGPDDSYAVVEMIFTFDAQQVNGSDASRGLKYFYPPQISPGPDLITYYPRSDQTLRIKGRGLLVGSKEDYSVLIGGDNCMIIQLTDNLLTCSPPIMKPVRQVNDSVYCSHTQESLPIQIKFTEEGAPFFYSCLWYAPDDTGLIIAGLSGGITSLLVTLTLLITLIVCCCQSSNTKSSENHASILRGERLSRDDDSVKELRNSNVTQYSSDTTISYRTTGGYHDVNSTATYHATDSPLSTQDTGTITTTLHPDTLQVATLEYAKGFETEYL